MSRLPASVRTAGSLALALTLTLWLAVGSALAAPGAQPYALEGLGELDYAADATGTVRPVSLGLVAELVGANFGSGSVLVPAGGGDVVTLPPASPLQKPSPVPSTAPPRPGPFPSPSPTPSPGPHDPIVVEPDRPVLSIDFSASRQVAEPGEAIQYRVRVTNVGRAPASNVVLSSHAPEGTVYDGQHQCGGEPVAVLPGDGRILCIDGDQVAGAEQPEPGEHVSKSWSNLPANATVEFSFWVHVEEDEPEGTRIYNHAHATAVGAEGVTSKRVKVVVSS